MVGFGSGLDARVGGGEAVFMQHPGPGVGFVGPAVDPYLPAGEPVAVHALDAVAVGNGGGVGEHQPPARGQARMDQRQELLRVGEPQRAPDRVERLPPLFGGGQEVDDVAVDVAGTGNVAPRLVGEAAVLGREVDAGGCDAVLRQRRDRIAPAGPEFQRCAGLAEELVAGAMVCVLGPAESVLQRGFAVGVGDPVGVVVPIVGGVVDRCRHGRAP